MPCLCCVHDPDKRVYYNVTCPQNEKLAVAITVSTLISVIWVKSWFYESSRPSLVVARRTEMHSGDTGHICRVASVLLAADKAAAPSALPQMRDPRAADTTQRGHVQTSGIKSPSDLLVSSFLFEHFLNDGAIEKTSISVL